jgi:hypothetical protein
MPTRIPNASFRDVITKLCQVARVAEFSILLFYDKCWEMITSTRGIHDAKRLAVESELKGCGISGIHRSNVRSLFVGFTISHQLCRQLSLSRMGSYTVLSLEVVPHPKSMETSHSNSNLRPEESRIRFFAEPTS